MKISSDPVRLRRVLATLQQSTQSQSRGGSPSDSHGSGTQQGAKPIRPLHADEDTDDEATIVARLTDQEGDTDDDKSDFS